MEVYLNGPVVITHTIKAGTVVKVVAVATIAAYFARNLVKAVDDSLGRANVTMTATKEDDKK